MSEKLSTIEQLRIAIATPVIGTSVGFGQLANVILPEKIQMCLKAKGHD